MSLFGILSPQLVARYRVAAWRRRLRGRFTVGTGTRLSGADLVVREAGGCRVDIGTSSDVSATLVLERAASRIEIGSRTHVGGGVVVDASTCISIGDDVLIGFGALFMDHDSHALDFDKRRDDVVEWLAGRKNWTHVPQAAIRIDDKVWVGARAVILKGVTLGVGSVVAAGSVVTRDVAAWTLVAGSPARFVRTLPGAGSDV